jgi:hypothetical protein
MKVTKCGGRADRGSLNGGAAEDSEEDEYNKSPGTDNVQRELTKMGGSDLHKYLLELVKCGRSKHCLRNGETAFCDQYTIKEKPGSSGSIVSDCGLDDRAIGVRSPAGAKDFPLTSVSRPALGPTQPPVQWVPGPFPGGKSTAGRDADHSLPSSAEVENE